MSPALRVAAKVAAHSTHRQHHHAAILTRGGSIVATGTNHGHVHAEVAALERVWPDQRVGLKLYSFRFTRSGALALAKPCKPCQVALRLYGVTVVYYSTTGGMERMRL
jgi:pyrimidine deaminase RibD-like protein